MSLKLLDGSNQLEMGVITMKDKKKKKKGRWLKRLIIVLLLLAALAVGGMYLLRGRMTGDTASYVSYTATTGSISNSLTFSGSLQLVDSETYTSPAKTTVREVYVAEGDDVKAGDKLLRLANGTTIEAEFDGRVNQLPIAKDDEVAAGDTLVQVADFSHMKVAVNVDEYDINSVRVGTACTISTTATEQTFQSMLDSINYISSGSGQVAYYTATAYVDVPEGVYPGMQVTLTITQEEATDVVVLKMDALSFDLRNQAYVLVKDAEDNMSQQYVTCGISNGNYVEITDGLEAGDVVYAVSEDSTAVGFGMGMSPFGSMSTEGMSMEDMMTMPQQRMQQNGTDGSGGFGGGFGGFGGGQ